jgi:hypothetical protein
MHSDIFDEFIRKLAADEKKAKEVAKLYDVKPETSKGMDAKNLTELAHPKRVVLVNTYDKLNGVIPNDNDKQTLTIKTLNKIPSGALDGWKRAQQDLADELNKIAIEIDDSEVSSLAIHSYAQVDPKFVKTAAAPLLLWYIGIPLLAGAFLNALNTTLGPVARSVSENGKGVMGAIDAIKSSGDVYDPSFIVRIDQVRNDVQVIMNALAGMPKLHVQLSNQDMSEAEIESATEQVRKVFSNLLQSKKRIAFFASKLQDKAYRDSITMEKGWWSTMRDWAGNLGGLMEHISDATKANDLSVFSNTFNELSKQLSAFLKATDKLQASLNKSVNDIKAYKSAAETEQAGQAEPVSTETAVESGTPPAKKTEQPSDIKKKIQEA